LRVIWGYAVEGFAIGLQKAQRSVVELLDLNFALVNLAMMEAAELDKIRQLRFPAVGPVMYMVAVHVSRVRTAGKSAAAIACVQCAAQRRGNAACLASDIEWLAVSIL